MARLRLSTLPLMIMLLTGGVLSADTVMVTVFGNMDPYLAGMPNGSTAKSGDVAPAQSPLLALTGFQDGSILTFATSSDCGFSYVGGCGPFGGGDSSADGDVGVDGATGAENGVAGIHAPYDALLGVFLDSNAPNGSPAPADLNFSGVGGIGLSFTSVSPGLKQVFFIGDGLTDRGSGTVQDFVAPAGATRLYLGSMDGFGWYNNGGFQDVTINFTPAGVTQVPEPSTFVLLGGSLLGLGFFVRRKR